MEAYEELERLNQGVMAFYSGEYEKAARFLQESAEAGWSEAYCLLGLMYADGLGGLAKDPERAGSYWNCIQRNGINQSTPVMLGRYPVSAGRTAPLTWFVLERRGNDVLLISSQIIDGRQYHHQVDDITWAQSDLRTWLNGEFLETAFSARERERLIARTRVQNSANKDYPGTIGGDNTVDQVFLLSMEEAQRYYIKGTPWRESGGNLSGDDSIIPNITIPIYYYHADKSAMGYCTLYAKSKELVDNIVVGSTSVSVASWWLRTPGCCNLTAAFAGYDGYLVPTGYNVDYICGVRPAMWLHLEATNGGTAARARQSERTSGLAETQPASDKHSTWFDQGQNREAVKAFNEWLGYGSDRDQKLNDFQKWMEETVKQLRDVFPDE